MDKLSLNIFILIPFIFALLQFAFVFIKNPIHIRNLLRAVFALEFVLVSFMTMFFNNINSTLLNFDFSFDKFSSIFLVLLNFLFFIFSLISKTFVTKNHRLLYSTSILLLGFLNIALLSSNILLFLAAIFFIFLINQKFDILWLILSSVFIGFDFLKYFLLNNIDFNFSSLAQNFSQIDDFSITLAFFGFLILTFKLLNFFPFSSLEAKKEPFFLINERFSYLILGCYLLIKTYLIFDYVFYQYQNYIAAYFLLNLLWFCALALKPDKVMDFINRTLSISLITLLFSLFSFELKGLSAFICSFCALIFSYFLSSLVLLILSNNYKTESFSEFKKIPDKNKLEKFFIFFSFLNTAQVPFLAMFSSLITTCLVIFSYDYDSVVLNSTPCCVLFGALILSYCWFNVINKVLIEPDNIYKNPLFSNTQINVFLIFISMIVLFGLFFSYIIKYFLAVLDIGSF